MLTEIFCSVLLSSSPSFSPRNSVKIDVLRPFEFLIVISKSTYFLILSCFELFDQIRNHFFKIKNFRQLSTFLFTFGEAERMVKTATKWRPPCRNSSDFQPSFVNFFLLCTFSLIWWGGDERLLNNL